MTNTTQEPRRLLAGQSIDDGLENLGCHGATMAVVRADSDTWKLKNYQQRGPVFVHYRLCGEKKIKTRDLSIPETAEEEKRFRTVEVQASNYLWGMLERDDAPILEELHQGREKELQGLLSAKFSRLEYELAEFMDWAVKSELARAIRAMENERRYVTARPGAMPHLGQRVLADLQPEYFNVISVDALPQLRGAVAVRDLLCPTTLRIEAKKRLIYVGF